VPGKQEPALAGLPAIPGLFPASAYISCAAQGQTVVTLGAAVDDKDVDFTILAQLPHSFNFIWGFISSIFDVDTGLFFILLS
jgi:hypothetical protein